MFSWRKELKANSKSVSQTPHEFSQLIQKLSSRYYAGWQQPQMSRPSQRLHGRNNLLLLSLWQVRLKWLHVAKPHPYSTRKRKEPRNYALPELWQSQKETASQPPVRTRSVLPCLCRRRRAGPSSKWDIKGVLGTAVTEHSRDSTANLTCKRSASQIPSTVLQAAWTGEHHDSKFHCCKI